MTASGQRCLHLDLPISWLVIIGSIYYVSMSSSLAAERMRTVQEPDFRLYRRRPTCGRAPSWTWSCSITTGHWSS